MKTKPCVWMENDGEIGWSGDVRFRNSKCDFETPLCEIPACKQVSNLRVKENAFEKNVMCAKTYLKRWLKIQDCKVVDQNRMAVEEDGWICFVFCELDTKMFAGSTKSVQELRKLLLSKLFYGFESLINCVRRSWGLVLSLTWSVLFLVLPW